MQHAHGGCGDMGVEKCSLHSGLVPGLMTSMIDLYYVFDGDLMNIDCRTYSNQNPAMLAPKCTKLGAAS